MVAVAALAPEDLAAIWEQCEEWRVGGRFASFEVRCVEAGLDSEWITAAISRYLAMLRYRQEYDSSSYIRVPEEHAALLTWLLVGELNDGRTSTEFDAELVDRLGSESGLEDRPSVLAWVVGRRVATEYWGPRVLATPGPLPLGPDVATAYQGLVEHAHALAHAADVFLELGHTSIVTRLAGVVDGLVMPSLRGAGPMPDAGKRLLKAYQRVESMLGPDDRRACRETLAEFRSHRNVLVHVDQDDADESFVGYAGLFTDTDTLKPRLATATSIVFGTVAEQQLRLPRPPSLSRVQRDLSDASYIDEL